MAIYKHQKICRCGKTFSTSDIGQALCDECEKKDKEKPKEKYMLSPQPKRRPVFDKIIPGISYQYGLFTINEETIKSFDLLDNRRKVSESHVTKLRRLLWKGRHFETPIITNRTEGKRRLIDGNHRIEAMSQLIKRFSGFEIQVLLIEYVDLTLEQEIQVFKLWNSGKPQSIDDFIKSIIHKLKFYSWIEAQFPVKVSIYKEKGAITLYLLANALLAAKRGNKQGRGIDRETFEEDLVSLDLNDYNFAEAWMKACVGAFGEPEWGNKHYSVCFFTAATFVAYEKGKALMELGEEMKIKLRDKKHLFTMAKSGSRESIEELIEVMKSRLRSKK